MIKISIRLHDGQGTRHVKDIFVFVLLYVCFACFAVDFPCQWEDPNTGLDTVAGISVIMLADGSEIHQEDQWYY